MTIPPARPPAVGRLPASALGPAAAAGTKGFGRQALHAAELGFAHPLTGGERCDSTNSGVVSSLP